MSKPPAKRSDQAKSRLTEVPGTQPSAEQKRLNDSAKGTPWRKWGPYLSERQWGTVREDYSEDGDAWDYFPPRSRPFPGVSLGRRRTGGILR